MAKVQSQSFSDDGPGLAARRLAAALIDEVLRAGTALDETFERMAGASGLEPADEAFGNAEIDEDAGAVVDDGEFGFGRDLGAGVHGQQADDPADGGGDRAAVEGEAGASFDGTALAALMEQFPDGRD